MAHLLHSSFLRSSSSLHQRKPIFPPSSSSSSRVLTSHRTTTHIPRDPLFPSMIISQVNKLSKAETTVVVESNIDVGPFHDGNSAAISVQEGGVLPSPSMDKVTDYVKGTSSFIDGKRFLYNSSFNFAVALAMDGELITSLLQDAHKADISSLSRKWRELVGKAQAKALQPHGYNTVNHFRIQSVEDDGRSWVSSLLFGPLLSMAFPQLAYASDTLKTNEIYEIGELFDLGIQLLYLILLLGLLGVGTFYVIRQVLVRRELDLSAKELQEQVRSGDASATELFELGAVMLRRKFYPAATKYLLQAIEKWDGDDQDLAQVYNALGVSYVRDGKLDKGIAQFEKAVKVQPGYVTAWNNLGDAYENKKEYKSALKAFEEVLLFDPNNKVARPRRDAMKERVQMYKGVPVKSKER